MIGNLSEREGAVLSAMLKLQAQKGVGQVRLRELAQHTGRSLSTVFEQVQALVEAGHVIKHDQGRRRTIYVARDLQPVALGDVHQAVYRHATEDVARQIMAELAPGMPEAVVQAAGEQHNAAEAGACATWPPKARIQTRSEQWAEAGAGGAGGAGGGSD